MTVEQRAAVWAPTRLPVRRDVERRFWASIAQGAPTSAAARACGVSESVGQVWFRNRGGMSTTLQLSPPRGRFLSFAEREEIALALARQQSQADIARQLGRSPSTVSREIARNSAPHQGRLEYRAGPAQWKAEVMSRRPKTAKLAADGRLRDYVQQRLSGAVKRPDGTALPGPQVAPPGRTRPWRQDRRWASAWSPEQISHRLRIEHPDDESMRVSHEAIYQSLFIQGRGALKRELVACLRTGRALRVPRERTRNRGAVPRGHVTAEVMISERPAEVEDRAVPGHWEGDLILGTNGSAIGTLVERTTRFTMLLHLPPMDGYGVIPRIKDGPALAGRGAQAVREAITATITTMPEQLRRSLTWDRGKELAQHPQLTIDADLDIYFADPHSPWQRGTNENTNGLLRQYFPKGTNLARWTRQDLDAVAAALNGRPRKTLEWRTPAEAIEQLLNSPPQAGVATTG